MQKLNYESKDFYFSAFIIAKGIPLKAHSRQYNVTTFSFDWSQDLEELVKQYYSMTALIEPIQYGNSIKALKSIIHSYSESNSNQHLQYELSSTKSSE